MKWRVPLHMKSNVWERYRRLQPPLHLEKMSLAGEHGGFLLPMDQTKCDRHISEKYSLAVANCQKYMGNPNLFEFPSQAALSWSIRFNISFPSKYQIRKMIGTAIAVFHELLPGDIIPVCLARHSRIVLPLAPPDGLILARNEFMPFRLPPMYQKKSDIEAQTPPVLRTQQKLPKLEMSSGILNKVEDFCEIVLMPDIAPLISAKTPTWSAWMMNLERNVKIPEAEMAEVRAAWTEWREQSVRLRQIRSHICKDVAELY